MALYLDLEVGEEVGIGKATVRVEKKQGRWARLQIDAPSDVPLTFAGRELDANLQDKTMPESKSGTNSRGRRKSRLSLTPPPGA